MGEQFTIVSAEEHVQIDQVRMLFREYTASLEFSLCFQSFENELASLPGEYAPPAGRLLLACWNTTVAGCVAMRKIEDGICEMKRLYVRPSFRGRGLGRDLVQTLIAQARLSLYVKMRLDTIAAGMTEAVGLYRSLGFQEIASYHDKPIPGAIFLELDLRQP